MSDLGKNVVRVLGLSVVAVAAIAPIAPGNSGGLGPSAALAQDAGGASTYLDELYSKARRLLDGKPRDPVAAAALLDQAVQAGDGRSMLALAELFARGDGVKANTARAKELMLAAIDAGLAQDGWMAIVALHAPGGASPDAALELDALRHAADLGDRKSMVRLADRLGTGIGVPVDFEGAKSWYAKAIAAGGDAAAIWSKLAALYANAAPPNRNMAEAAKAYSQAADLGDAWSMVALGRILGRGEDGVAPDIVRADALLGRATKSGGDVATAAEAVLGQIYADQTKPWHDPLKAVAALQRAADGGDAWSMVALGRILGRGDGVPADFKRARKLLDKAAAAQGDAGTAAWAALGQLYGDAAKPWHDPALAAAAYQHAADGGDRWSMVSLGRMLGFGDGVPADVKRAAALLEKAGSGDDNLAASAMSTLGALYGDGTKPWHEPAKSLGAYRRAAELGDPWAMVSYGRMLGRGEGAPADFEAAKAVLDRAIANGEVSVAASAWSTLAQLYADDSRPWHDGSKALDAYRRAADLGDAWAMASAGRMLARGEGVPPDFDAARPLLDRAIAAGGAPAGAAWGIYGGVYRDQYQLLKAADAFRRAADLGDAWSMASLGRMMARGDGIPVDVEAAKARLLSATKAGGGAAASAWSTLGQIYARRDTPDYDLAKAADAFRQAAELGDPWAMVSYGRMRGRGEGVAANFGEARSMLERAIATDPGVAAAAWNALGQVYSDGGKSWHSPRKAVDAFQKAADLGDVWSMMTLARMYAAGEGVRADFEGARTLFEMAAKDSGAAGEAFASLGDLYRTATPKYRDRSKALAYYDQAAAAGLQRAHLDIANLTQSEVGTPEQVAALLAHYRAAVGDVEPAAVAKAMFLVQPKALRAMVQLLLSESGQDVGAADGVFGARTQRAIAQFCVANRIRSCGQGIVTVDLLAALLAANPSDASKGAGLDASAAGAGKPPKKVD